MMLKAVTETYELIERKIIKAPRSAVFRAWTTAEALQTWFGPGSHVTEKAEVDLRVGGEYALYMRSPGSEVLKQRGVYREIVTDEKLVFTWMLEGQDCDGCSGEYAETLVTIEFNEYGEHTELVLSHNLLPSEKSRDNHHEGWILCFAELYQYLEERSA